MLEPQTSIHAFCSFAVAAFAIEKLSLHYQLWSAVNSMSNIWPVKPVLKFAFHNVRNSAVLTFTLFLIETSKQVWLFSRLFFRTKENRCHDLYAPYSFSRVNCYERELSVTLDTLKSFKTATGNVSNLLREVTKFFDWLKRNDKLQHSNKVYFLYL